VAASAALQVAAQVIPVTRRLFGLTTLGIAELMGIGAIALGSTLVNDVIGYALRDGHAPSG
jgi:Ca2+-transporting ATPase